MTEPVALGLIGCGGMMGAHVKGLAHLWQAGRRDFRVVATCDTDEARAAKFADDLAAIQGARPAVYTDFQVMLGRERGMEAADISVVHRDHHTVTIPCLEAGKHVTKEKPIAFTLRAGKLILDAAARAGTVFQVAENYRRSPRYRAIHWALKSGRIGKVRMLYWLDVRERRWYWGWREHRSAAGGGWTLDGGVHEADLFRYFVGEVETVTAQIAAFDPVRFRKPDTLEDAVESDLEDSAVRLLKFKSGALGIWAHSWAAPGSASRLHAIYGATGSLLFEEGINSRTEHLPIEQLEQEYMAGLSPQEQERLFPGGVTDTVATELQEFFRAVRGGPPVEITGLEAYKDQAVCEAVYESVAARRPVRVAAVESLKAEKYQQPLNEEIGLV